MISSTRQYLCNRLHYIKNIYRCQLVVADCWGVGWSAAAQPIPILLFSRVTPNIIAGGQTEYCSDTAHFYKGELPMANPIISIDKIHKSYLMGKEAVPALRGVSLDIEEGDFVCLMGPSGSGKTTLLNIVGGLDEPSRGHVTVDGENLVAMSEDELAKLRLQKMGFIFQNYNLLANFTAQENVEAPMVLAKVSRRERTQRTLSLLEKVDLLDRAHHYPGELSGGQQQRVAVARALANNPSILIGDEVTGDLDSESGLAIMRLLAQLNEEGMTIVYVTHDPVMAEFAQRLIHLYDGVLTNGDDSNPVGEG
jgi:putative ABC transport system ATP-binding protein